MLITATCLLAATPLLQVDAQPHAISQQLLKTVVLEHQSEKFTARDILSANKWGNDALLEALQRDPQQATLFLNSPAFLSRVRSFADARNLDSAKITPASEEQIQLEASAWAKDRQRKTPPGSVLINHGIEISNRARILNAQQSRFGTADLRQHMLSSVPEFFGEISVSLLRIPLVDFSTGHVVNPEQREKTYQQLDQIAKQLGENEVDWETAVKTHSIKSDHKKSGFMGIIRRNMSNKFEEPLLRSIFTDLGFKMPTQSILRGPIITESWAYLARIETVRTRGVVDLQQVRDRVERSLREKLLQEKLSALRSVGDAKYLLPITTTK